MNEAQTGAQSNELDLRILRSDHNQHSMQSGADGPLVSQATIESEPPRYEITGNLALKPETNVLDMKPRLATKLAVVPEVKAKAEAKKPRTAKAKARAAKIVSTKEECDWLKKSFPATIEGATGSWSVRANDAGFEVYFRVKQPTINERFPRISRAMFLTLKGMNDGQRKAIISDYIAGHLDKRGEKGRSVAARIALAS